MFTTVSQGTIYVSYSLLPHSVQDKKVQLCTIVEVVLYADLMSVLPDVDPVRTETCFSYFNINNS